MNRVLRKRESKPNADGLRRSVLGDNKEASVAAVRSMAGTVVEMC